MMSAIPVTLPSPTCDPSLSCKVLEIENAQLKTELKTVRCMLHSDCIVRQLMISACSAQQLALCSGRLHNSKLRDPGPTVCCTLCVVPSRAMYDQLVVETSEERFDERRVLLLKGQVLQLERQVGKDVAM